ncbi:YiiX/YebB-like N1pC/P60 family cysteine hydrolase [Candidatus Sororendozoicomonas aggregata]|uniref:YiiX/YebB-like N1pC/P60 family cysteine hydrolase n=1 Tax=Candidatus Sororendozoicomonas aggregata TaxID=3073239 RepID=UPI002ED5D370
MGATQIDLSPCLKPGDFLFQYAKNNDAGETISQMFEGVNGHIFNHVATYMGNEQVIEAVPPQVQSVSLSQFIEASVVDTNNQPCITIARITRQYQSLIPEALAFIKNKLSAPYDESFCSDSGWYCSKLIISAFEKANNDAPVFELQPMSFKNPQTGEFYPFWEEHYQQLGMAIPEGLQGSHPATMSLSEHLDIVTFLGGLPYKSRQKDFFTETILA